MNTSRRPISMGRRLCQALARMWDDVCGTVDCAGYLLMATILGIGVLVGIATYREQVVQEFGDIAESLESLDQSYSYKIGNREFRFEDDNTKQAKGQPPAGIRFNDPPTEEKADKRGGEQ